MLGVHTMHEAVSPRRRPEPHSLRNNSPMRSAWKQGMSPVSSLLIIVLLVGSSHSMAAVSTPPSRNPISNSDTARYVEWMAEKGTPVIDVAHENAALRHGEWGFFSQRREHQGPRDLAALDRSGHVVVPSDTGDWYAFLSSPGLTAAGALQRVAFLYRARGIDPVSAPKVSNREKVTAPTLIASTHVVTFQGWLLFPPNMGDPLRLTIIASPRHTKLVFDSAKKL